MNFNKIPNLIGSRRFKLAQNADTNVQLELAQKTKPLTEYDIIDIVNQYQVFLDEREKFWIKELNSIVSGYNLTDGGTGGDTFTKNINKEEIREKLKKRIVSEEVKKLKIKNLKPFPSGESHPGFGKKQTEKTKNKRKNTFLENGYTSPMKNKNHTEESKQKIRNKKIGIKLSDETKFKMSQLKKGKSKKIIKCPHCNKEGGEPQMYQWHFEKCKFK